MTEKNERRILEKLVISEEDFMKNLEKLVDEAGRIFRIEQKTGRIIFEQFGELTDRQRILALLTGKFFAKRLGIIEDSTMSISEISEEIGRPLRTLSARMGELVGEGYVEKLPGRKYQITYHRIKEMFAVYFPS